MAEYLSPGVYMEEFESGPRPMSGVSTSTAGFIGIAEKGPVRGTPQLVTNFGDFRRKYGGYMSETECGSYRFLAYAVEHFFNNGGSRCYVMRVCLDDAQAAFNEIKAGETALFKIEAKDPGKWGNDIKITCRPASKAKTQVVEIIKEESGAGAYKVKRSGGFDLGDVVVYIKESVSDSGVKTFEKQYNRVTKVTGDVIEFEKPFGDNDIVDDSALPSKYLCTAEFEIEMSYEDIVEKYEFVSLNIESANFIEKKVSKSCLIQVSYDMDEYSEFNGSVDALKPPYEIISGESTQSFAKLTLAGGSNGNTALYRKDDEMVNVFTGEGDPTAVAAGKRKGLNAFYDNDVVSLMIIPGVTNVNIQLKLVGHCESLKSRFAILDIPRSSKSMDDIINHRNILDSDYAAMYHPWLEIFDPLNKKNNIFPPSGAVAGIYSRSDQERGVYKAPANEVVKGAINLDCVYNKGEQDILNPMGVNLIRPFPGYGIRVWGARTCSSNSLWKYINVRRLFIYLEESIKANTNWVVFEPNDELLWIKVKRTIDVFLSNVWKSGALFGSSESEAYFIDIGRSTMSQDDIDNGRLICVIGVAPVKPAEFVIFRLTQKTMSE